MVSTHKKLVIVFILLVIFVIYNIYFNNYFETFEISNIDKNIIPSASPAPISTHSPSPAPISTDEYINDFTIDRKRNIVQYKTQGMSSIFYPKVNFN